MAVLMLIRITKIADQAWIRRGLLGAIQAKDSDTFVSCVLLPLMSVSRTRSDQMPVPCCCNISAIFGWATFTLTRDSHEAHELIWI
jgi:hypothetical protein